MQIHRPGASSSLSRAPVHPAASSVLARLARSIPLCAPQEGTKLVTTMLSRRAGGRTQTVRRTCRRATLYGVHGDLACVCVCP